VQRIGIFKDHFNLRFERGNKEHIKEETETDEYEGNSEKKNSSPILNKGPEVPLSPNSSIVVKLQL